MSMLMAIDGFDTAAVVVLLFAFVIGGWIAVVVTLRRWVRAELEDLSVRLYEHVKIAQEQLDKVTAAQTHEVTAKQANTPALEAPPAAPVEKVEATAEKPDTKAGSGNQSAASSGVVVVEEEISPEILAVITAAVAHFCGANARIRHAQMVQNIGSSAWAQQGRCYIQASHNLAAQRAYA